MLFKDEKDLDKANMKSDIKHEMIGDLLELLAKSAPEDKKKALEIAVLNNKITQYTNKMMMYFAPRPLLERTSEYAKLEADAHTLLSNILETVTEFAKNIPDDSTDNQPNEEIPMFKNCEIENSVPPFNRFERR